MTPFSRFALFTMARDASFVSIGGGMLMMALSSQPPLAFDVGATIALVFSLGLIFRALFLTEERVTKSEAWLVLPDIERPTGEEGQQRARLEMQELLLRFAKSTAGVAGILYGSALVISIA